MIPNDRPSSSGQRFPSPSGAKPHVEEKTLKTDKVQIERKSFIFTLKENPRGRFLRITEDVNGRRDTIIVPATGLGESEMLLANMAKCSAETPLPAV